MSITVAVSGTYAVAPPDGAFRTALTLGVTVYDSVGSVSVARSTAGSHELVAGTGLYSVVGTAPSSSGPYIAVVDDGSYYWSEDLLVPTVVVPGTVLSGSLDVAGVGSVVVDDSSVIPSPSTLLKTSGVLSVSGTGVVSLSTNRGTTSHSHRPSVDATYLRNFPIHRNIGGSRP